MISVERLTALNSSALAYVGDSIYEVYIRCHVLQQGGQKQKYVHHQVTKYVSAKAQFKIVECLLERDYFTTEEIGVFKKGRNAKSGSIPKNTSIQAYKYATGFEAVVGYLYVVNKQRLEEVVLESIRICEEQISE